MIEADAGQGRHEGLLVRVVDERTEAVYFAAPPGWGEFDLSSLVSEQAEAQDLPLDLAARRFTTVEVPSLRENHQGWRWHPWLGFTRQR